MDISTAPYTERQIARFVVLEAIEAGYTVSVNDGGEWVVKRSTDKVEIMSALYSTSDDMLRFRNAEGESVGWVWLIWGNGEDLISDYADNDATNALVRAVESRLAI